ncbi:hypothetical protein Wcon_00799 [Wolbachia endosymbiont of Cylisticus convexus]|nr:hypothetical protein Wcon_00799 [Wolbachia endosymbiont of Cylisticus convexus]
MEGNQDAEAYRQHCCKNNGELPGCSESEHIGDLESNVNQRPSPLTTGEGNIG